MAVTVQEATDADLLRACEMEVAAYANYAAAPVLFPGPFPSNSTENRVNELMTGRRKDPTIHYLKAVDDQTGEQMAFAKWHIYDTPEAATSAKRDLRFGPGTNEEACIAFFGTLAQRKKEIVGGKPHVYLHLLHTDPKYQGMGAGGALMQWGLQKAEELHLPIYLESSPDAHRFYQKHGFKDIEDFPFGLKQYGGPDKLHVFGLIVQQTVPTQIHYIDELGKALTKRIRKASKDKCAEPFINDPSFSASAAQHVSAAAVKNAGDSKKAYDDEMEVYCQYLLQPPGTKTEEFVK